MPIIVLRVPRRAETLERAIAAFRGVGADPEVVQGRAPLADVAAHVTASYDGVYLALLNAMVVINILAIRRMRARVRLYDAGVRYEREPPGAEVWQSTPALLLTGKGDCEDLVLTWVAEECVRLGLPPDAPGAPKVRLTAARREDGGLLYHVTALRPDGGIEDPSRVLGMGREAA